MAKTTNLPIELSTNIGSDTNSSNNTVWLRITAFLQMRSVNTQHTYLGIVKEWCEFLGATAGTEKAANLIINAKDLHAIAYKTWLEQRPGQKPRAKVSAALEKQVSKIRLQASSRDGLQASQTNATIAKKFAALRRIYRMLIASNLGASENPFDTDRVPPPAKAAGQKRPTEMVSFDLVSSIIALPDVSTPKGLRDRALLALLFGGGLRRSEVTKLRIADLQKTSQATSFVRLRATKAKKDFDQALPDWAAQPIWELVAQRKIEKAETGDFLFVSYRGKAGMYATQKALSPSGLYKLFLNYCRLAGVENYVSPHSARATAITKLLTEGFNHREVQEFSRHASVQMVEVYDKRRISVDQSPGKVLKF